MRYLLTGLFCLMAALSCSKLSKPASFAEVSDCAGRVTLKGSAGETPLEKGSAVASGDSLIVPADCRLSLCIGKNLFISLSGESRAAITWAAGRDSTVSAIVGLAAGEAFVHSDIPGNAVMVRSPVGGASGSGASFGVWYAPERQAVVVAVIAGEAEAFSAEGTAGPVRACEKLLVEEGAQTPSVSLTSRDFEELKGFVPPEVLSAAVSRNPCVATETASSTELPVWTSDSSGIGSPGQSFCDTVAASSGRGGPLRYVLLNPPAEAAIGERSGILRLTPKAPGALDLRIQAADSLGGIIDMRYLLTVSGALTAVLRCPERVNVGDSVILDAGQSLDEKGSRTGLSYRFDPEGTGTFVLPAGAQSQMVYTCTRAGSFRPRVEVRSASGGVASADRELLVVKSLSLAVSCEPAIGRPGMAYRFSAEAGEALQTRWDFDGDGIFDVPAQGFTDDPVVTHICEKVGMRRVRVEAVNAAGAKASADYQLMVYSGPRILSLDCPDTVNINAEFTVSCTASDPDFPIVEYSFDPAGTGVATQSGPGNSLKLSYAEAKVYTLVVTVTDEKGLAASETKRICAVNNATTVDAGGPYRAAVNVPLELSGMAHDADSKILSFTWVFDDGSAEAVSGSSARIMHTYKKGGRHLVRFGVKTDDGTTTWDSAVVGIENHAPIAFAGKDFVARSGHEVKLTGRGRDVDGNIARYEWDFDADGKFDWSGSDTLAAPWKFKAYAKPVLKVTDAEGASSFDTVNVVICPEGMATMEQGAFCIDRYEFPNKRGTLPQRDMTYAQASGACAQQGKRLCTFDEFETTCRGGTDRNDYPYGRKYLQGNCNTYGNGHAENKPVKSREFENCAGRLGVYDMTGNVAEWTSTGNGDNKRVAGGWWQNAEESSKCGTYVMLDKSKKYFYAGFRCCK